MKVIPMILKFVFWNLILTLHKVCNNFKITAFYNPRRGSHKIMDETYAVKFIQYTHLINKILTY